MKNRTILLLTLMIFACFVSARQVESAGILVKVESLSSGQFDPYSGGKSVLTFDMLKDTEVIATVRIFDMKNIMLLEKKLGTLKEGQYKFTWDGKDGKGKVAEEGFYKYELLAITSDKKISDNDNTLVEVRKGKAGKVDIGDELPPVLYPAGTAAGADLTVDVKGHVRSTTGANTGGVNWNREEIYLNLKGDKGIGWVYDITLFPSYTMNQIFQWNNFIYNALIGYRLSWAGIEFGYRNYLEGYYDPLNLLADYMMGSDRLSLRTKLNLLDKLSLLAGVHRAIDLNQTGIEGRATYEIFPGISAGGSLVANLYPLYRNTVIAGDARVDFGGLIPLLSGTIVNFEAATNLGATKLDDTHPEIPFGGTAVRLEAEHKMFYIPSRYGELIAKFAFQNVGSQFVADYGDVPNGIDSVGTEMGGTYSKDFGLATLRSLRTETKGTFLINSTQTIKTTRFRQNVSVGFIEGLSFVAQYEYSGRDNSTIFNTAPISKTNIAYGELRYYKSGGKIEMALRANYSSDTLVTSASATEYFSAYCLLKYYLTSSLAPYLAYERARRFYGIANIANQEYDHIMPGFQ